MAFVWLGLASAAQAQTFDVMDRRGELLGWEGVGRLDTSTGFCTATLIARDVVLTAAHCVFDRATGAPLPARGMVFRAGYHHGQAIATARGLRVATPEAYQPTTDGQASDATIAHDVALIKLDAPITSAEADPFRVLQGAPPGTKVSVVSYGQGRDQVLSRQPECSLTGRYRDGVLAFDCNVTFGSSGAPVFARIDGRLRILSVISSSTQPGARGSTAYGMTLPPLVAELSAKLRRADARAPVSAGARRLGAGQRGDTGARFVRP
ncbi:MAG: trypsin-like peptidase domain-containing protein [Paracoccaceae bacterium]|nr:trypsin-like peptidase domain-containing protein [Paracoccaceae bacterium]